MTIVETIEDARGGFATQAGMEKMEVTLRSDLRNDMEMMELRLRADMQSLRADMQSVRADMQADFKKLYLYIPAVMGVMVGILKIT